VSLNPTSTPGFVQGQCLQILADRQVSDGTVSITPGDIQSTPVGDYLQISVSAPCASNSLFGSMFYSGKTLTSTVEMMKEFQT